MAVGLAGGLADLVRPGALVLIKPNLVAVPDQQRSGACTSPEVCKALANLVRELGGRPIIAESSAIGVDTEKVIEKMGYHRLREEGYEVVDLKATPTVKLEISNGEVLKDVTTFELVTKADVIISVPVMKTHDQCEVTLSLKNLKGLGVDRDKKWMHKVGVNEGVSDINSVFKPALAVIDAIWTQEGLGPMWGLPVEMDLIIASRDLVAADAVASAIMGFEPREILTTRYAEARGLGTADMSRIHVVGEPIQGVQRRFLRMIEDARLRMDGFDLVHAHGTCTGCRNGVMSSLFDLKNQGLLDHVKGLTILTGDGEPPHGVSEDNLLVVGVCCRRDLRQSKRYVKGCPPNNIDIVQAIMRGRNMKSPYATE
jgi:uncharacterized protein (DUF362 family)